MISSTKKIKEFIKSQKVFEPILYDLMLFFSLAKASLIKVIFKTSKKDISDFFEYDLVFVNTEKGWILEGICNHIARYFPGKCYFHDSLERIPKSKAYFFSHYSLFIASIHRNPNIIVGKSLVFYTHPRSIGISENKVIRVLRRSEKVISMNSENKEMLIKKGLNSNKVSVVIGGADEDFFIERQKQASSYPCFGFCLRYNSRNIYKDRKNYDLIFEIIKKVDFANVILLGENWRAYENFDLMNQLSYFTYIESEYKNYPNIYNLMDVFVSVSKLEGGPIPLLEAMMCNVFPVVSKTGFAPDIIRDGENGFLFDPEATPSTIISLIKKATKKSINIRESVQDYTWRKFSLEIQRISGLL